MASTPMGTAGGIIAFATATNGVNQLLYLIDTKTQAFAIYQVGPASVKLDSARNYASDLKLTEYNNVGMGVDKVKAAVQTLPSAAATR
jgi:hypothetical protein